MFSIVADYQGGDPDAVRYIDCLGTLSIDEGVVAFTLEYREPGKATHSMMSSKKGEIRTPIVIGSDIFVSIAPGDVRQLTGGRLGLLGTSSRLRNYRLVIIAQREHGPISVVFGVDDSDARRFIDVLQRWRLDAGLTTRDLAEVGATSEAGDAAGSLSLAGDGILIEIRDLLSEIRDLLRLSRP